MLTNDFTPDETFEAASRAKKWLDVAFENAIHLLTDLGIEDDGWDRNPILTQIVTTYVSEFMSTIRGYIAQKSRGGSYGGIGRSNTPREPVGAVKESTKQAPDYGGTYDVTKEDIKDGRVDFG